MLLSSVFYILYSIHMFDKYYTKLFHRSQGNSFLATKTQSISRTRPLGRSRRGTKHTDDGRTALDRVGCAHRAGPHPVGFGVADKLRLEQIELQVSLQLLADVCRQADAHGSIHDVRVRHRWSARADAVEEISHVVHRPACPGCVFGELTASRPDSPPPVW